MNTIGQTARQLGVSPHTLRYYEKIGLLAPVAKDTGGRRNYRTADIERIRFVKRAQRMHFSLDEIKQLLNLEQLEASPTASPKQDAQELVRSKLSAIEENLTELKRLKKDLNGMLKDCLASDENEDCPIIEGFKEK